MKKISVVLIFILAFLFAPAVHAEVQNTLSDEILVQGKAQAVLFLELKNALGLDWLDKYNAYLQNPASKPVPTWDTSISSLINKGYLSAAFPTDFAVSILGNEAQISRNISSQAVRNAVKIYIPSATVSGNTVKLLVQRPAQWVAYESALNGKVSRDGSDSPDVLPGAQLDFGSGASINFISNDGKILGVNSLTYKGEEADTRFVNAAGDNMTGDLTIKGNKAWHAGNDGAGSGLDADLLDGQSGSFYQNAGNLNAGIVPTARLSGTYNISISGNAATATNANYASSAGNADTVDGKHASDFALSGHTHGQYVQKTGDTMTGTLTFNNTLSSANKLLDLQQGYAVYSDNTGGSNNTRLWVDAPNGGEVIIGPRAGANFLNDIRLRSQVINLETNGNQDGVTINGNKVWHAGNDGSGSELDADMLDGKHWSDIQNYINDKHNPNKKIYFVAQRSPSQYIAWENKADLTIEEDPYNCFDIAADRFIAPREGLYFFSGVGLLNKGKGAHIYCFFKVNGNILPESQFSTETGEASNTHWDWQSHTSTILHLKTGDYVELWVGAGGWHVSKIVFYGIEL